MSIHSLTLLLYGSRLCCHSFLWYCVIFFTGIQSVQVFVCLFTSVLPLASHQTIVSVPIQDLDFKCNMSCSLFFLRLMIWGGRWLLSYMLVKLLIIIIYICFHITKTFFFYINSHVVLLVHINMQKNNNMHKKKIHKNNYMGYNNTMHKNNKAVNTSTNKI
jgi:hypothetical protein